MNYYLIYRYSIDNNKNESKNNINNNHNNDNYNSNVTFSSNDSMNMIQQRNKNSKT